MRSGFRNRGFQHCFGGIFILGFVPLAVVSGCANPGPPRPPSLNLPEVVSTLFAERVGDEVHLRWTTSGKTTDGLAVRGAVTAVVCRRAVVKPEASCAPVLRLPVSAGPSQAVDQLSPSLAAGAPSSLEYQVALLNSGGHTAGNSPVALTLRGAAPPRVGQLHVTASQEGAVLAWDESDVLDSTEFHRVRSSDLPLKKQEGMARNKVETSDTLLRVAPGKATALDRTAAMGERYTYTAQRVRSVTLAGHVLELRSALSAPVMLEMRDVFPPRRPIALEAVAEGEGVDLSWEPNTESDLAGYVVFRQEDGVSIQVSPVILLVPSFEDKTIRSGHTYSYIVVAVDLTGNRSSASEPAHVLVHSSVP